ncbi:hypothetical protein HK102_000834 [Quaeritorhiza haematococci]|nr:hypothetical protein HK102_000834 [Quaeritorhiza haematococci]
MTSPTATLNLEEQANRADCDLPALNADGGGSVIPTVPSISISHPDPLAADRHFIEDVSSHNNLIKPPQHPKFTAAVVSVLRRFSHPPSSRQDFASLRRHQSAQKLVDLKVEEQQLRNDVLRLDAKRKISDYEMGRAKSALEIEDLKLRVQGRKLEMERCKLLIEKERWALKKERGKLVEVEEIKVLTIPPEYMAFS